MNYKSFNLGDWIGHISGVIEDEGELDGNEMRDLVEFLSGLPRWIPISERLPEEIKTRGHGLCNVLVTHKYAGITRTHQAVFDQGKFLKLETYKEDNTVTAWMPLPEPYKAESEDI